MFLVNAVLGFQPDQRDEVRWVHHSGEAYERSLLMQPALGCKASAYFQYDACVRRSPVLPGRQELQTQLVRRFVNISEVHVTVGREK